MAKPQLGTKRICPETGRKFYDLNRDPIVSPYTGQSYPRSFFESDGDIIVEEEEDVEDKELSEDGPEIVSLEDADEETKGGDTDLPDIDDDEDVDIDTDGDDTFLEEEEEEDDDVKGIIGVGEDDEER
ncbi:TIGR02300 family protein [Chelativorans salis]|uniref:TIGR02300 family protein n=1 Tax=Chelativorans salis TaxID=2978478 RepID=A0ABT2LSG5_9HYPH|nr:TIGR02300 family protein [Chelativorans sp. EGI FJ00035]MCT7376114.1 TIGR02300 family protein [Chelativorans sp. EGI FJ00035]